MLAALASIVLLSGPLPDTTQTYFDRENALNGAYTALGAAGIGLGIWLTTRDDALASSAGYPVAVVGGIQLTVGVIYLALTPGLKAGVNPHRMDDERARIDGLVDLFPIYQIVEGTAVAAGIATLTVGAFEEDPALTGVGIGLAAAAAIQLLMETAARDVAEDYRLQITPTSVSLSF